MADQTILGCPISSFLALESACTATAIPACETAASVNYNAACCSDIYSFGLSIASCYEKHAPACLDTSAALASLSAAGTATFSNPCAAYLGGMGGGGSAPTTAAMTSAPTAAPAATTGAGTAAAGGGSSGSDSSASSTASTSPSSTAKPNSAVSAVSAGLKVYIGVALIGALAVLNL